MIQHYRARIEVRKDVSGHVAYVDLRLNGNRTSALQLDVPVELKKQGQVYFDFENSSYHVGGDLFEYDTKRGLVGVLSQMSDKAQDVLISAFRQSSRFVRTIPFDADDGRACCSERGGIRVHRKSRIASVGRVGDKRARD